MLPVRFEEPAGFTWGNFKDAGGANIRYGSLQPQGEPKGTIVLVSGFRESTEKYFEVIRDMADRGFAVWMMDWRGQGGSDRFLAHALQRLHSKGFDDNIATLHQFTQTVVKKSNGPLILMGHSMGGHLCLRYLKEHEGVFDSAVLTSPMCDILTPGLPRVIAHRLIDLARVGHYMDRYIPGGHNWDERNEDFDSNKLTSDPVRFGVATEIFRKNPAMKMGDPTYAWVEAAFKSIKTLNDPAYLKSIKTPVLMGISGNDQIVDAAASRNAAALMPNCTRVDIPGAKHEIWMERDELRAPWLDRVGTFLQERLEQYALTQKKSNIKQPPRPPGP